ncbi:MAG: SDR family oxidoreductase [Paludibacteraceae bacterium]
MGKTILITGGTKGIGFSVAEILVKSGYHLILTYANDSTQATSAKTKLSTLQSDASVQIIQADITQTTSITIITDHLKKQHIKLYSVIFNAGLTCRTPFEQFTTTEWEQVFFANVHFPVFLLQRLINNNFMKKEGNVLFTGSLMGEYPHSVSLAYGVTKSAVHSLVKNLVKFLQPYHIRVNGIAPGFVDTEWQKTKPAEIRKSIEGKIALGRFCEPEELSEVYKMIVENAYFNGEIVTLSGGYSFK